MTNQTLRWGVIGPGTIAHKFAEGLTDAPSGVLYAAASRDLERAEAFIQKHGGEKAYDHYQALLDDPKVDAVYIATPHPMHAEWAIKAARAGKHILCEKPIALNLGETQAIVSEAEEAGVALLEAFMYRCHPQTKKLYELVAGGAVGKVIRITGQFAFDGGPNPEGRHQSNALGGGGILDVGCYPVSACRLIAGAANGKPFCDPLELKGAGHLDETTGVDTWASAVMKFEGDIVAEVFCGVRAKGENQLKVHGSKGVLTVKTPWFCGGEIVLQEPGQETAKIDASSERRLYAFEIEALAELVRTGVSPHPAMSIEDTIGNMRALDQWRQQLNFRYESEIPGPDYPVAHGGKLGPLGERIPKGAIRDVDKPVSRLCMGGVWPGPFSEVVPTLDAFFEWGGNCFDDASHYRGFGMRPSFAGLWMTMRGVREQCVLIDKGAHTPFAIPALMETEVDNNLRSNRAGYIDIYMMHRDNLEVPAGEFVDVINRMIDAGKIRAYGFSNWTLPRIDEAIAYAREKGLRAPTSLSNQFSLAEMVNPVWPGCLSVHDEASRQWIQDRKFALAPWSSQAAGFFTDQSHPDREPERPLLKHGYYSDANFERKRRVYELAEKKKTAPINISLAWVLAQPFDTFPIIGPRSISELRTSLAAFEVPLSPEELAWLDLKA